MFDIISVSSTARLISLYVGRPDTHTTKLKKLLSSCHPVDIPVQSYGQLEASDNCPARVKGINASTQKPQMKRTHSGSPVPAAKQSKHVAAATCLTDDALKEHDQKTRPLSFLTLLDMDQEGKVNSLSAVSELSSPSKQSSQSSWSSRLSRHSDARYRGNTLRRANIHVDGEIPADISHYANNRVFNLFDGDDEHLRKISQRLWEKSKEIVRISSGKTEWTGALYRAIDELSPTGLRIAYNQGRLPSS